MDEETPKRPTRRRFLRAATAGAVMAGGPALAGNPKNLPPNVPEWTRVLGDGVAVRPYGKPSKHEAHVIRRDVQWLTASRESSVSFTPLHELDGIITPNGLCFERHHGGIAEIDPEDYRLIIHGLVEKPLIFTLADLKRLPRVNRIHFLECAANSGMEWKGAQLNGCQYTHGMLHCVEYTGVPLRVLLEEAGVKPNAKWLLAEGADAAAAGAAGPQGLHGDVGAGVVRTREGNARRCLARWRQELARSQDRRLAVGQGLRALLRRDRVDRRRNAAAITRHRRVRLCAA